MEDRTDRPLRPCVIRLLRVAAEESITCSAALAERTWQERLRPCGLVGAAIVVAMVALPAQAETPLEALRRIAASIPQRARVEARWQCRSAPRKMDVDAALERLRREFERNKPDDPHIAANVTASRSLYEQLQRGATDVRDREYAWEPERLHIEERVDGADGKPQSVGLYYNNGASYRISRLTEFEQVQRGVTILSGSMTEMLYLCGLRLDSVVEPASLSLRTADGRDVLTGELDFGSGPWCFAKGSRFELVADTQAGSLPIRLRVWAHGRLQESSSVAIGRFGDMPFARRIEVSGYYGRREPSTVWTIEPTKVSTALDGRAFTPRARTPLNVFDMRVPGKTVSYRLERGRPFRSLDEVGLLAASQTTRSRDPDPTRSVLMLRIGAIMLVGLAAATSRRYGSSGV